MFLSHQCIFTGWGWMHICGLHLHRHVLYKLPRSSKLTMSSYTPWKTLILVLLQGFLILADDPNSIGLGQIQDGDLSAGPTFVLSGESGGDLIASSWTPDESENRNLAISEAESIACAGFPSQNQDQKPAKSSKSRKTRRWDHRKRDGADAPPGFCRFDAPWRRTQPVREEQPQVNSGQEITPATGSSLFPLPDTAFFKIKRLNNIFVCHLLSAGSLQASSPVAYLEPCRRCKFTHVSLTRDIDLTLLSRLIKLRHIGSTTGRCTPQEDLWLCTYILPRISDGNPNVSNIGPGESSLAKLFLIHSTMTCSNLWLLDGDASTHGIWMFL